MSELAGEPETQRPREAPSSPGERVLMSKLASEPKTQRVREAPSSPGERVR
ncbi:hypothetical protein [Sciscionella marina]|uniref:hypothetical protein n=1 Tax=Sciscionella marina TaxID=508770 RepID=UPI000376296C|nr:hypothetical protein [Sciscionella marina]